MTGQNFRRPSVVQRERCEGPRLETREDAKRREAKGSMEDDLVGTFRGAYEEVREQYKLAL